MDHHTIAPVERYAAAAADAVCDLYDAVAPETTWPQGATEDVVDALDVLAQLLAARSPGARFALAGLPRVLGELRASLGLEGGPEPTRRSRITRTPGGTARGLGPGYQGITAPRVRRALGTGPLADGTQTS
ncbi:hypothetical protein [Streptomyces sp. NRRL F-5630]|uniref:hypothetical protein n=1 Tax=Streptomyces sp. NRRL F-5630 TaxID=1463864 RepID=UPI003EBDD4D0